MGHYMVMILLLLVLLMNHRLELEKLVHQFFTYREIKLCFQYYVPHKMDTNQGFLDRLFDNLEIKKNLIMNRMNTLVPNGLK